jgi:hypothetical protein
LRDEYPGRSTLITPALFSQPPQCQREWFVEEAVSKSVLNVETPTG